MQLKQDERSQLSLIQSSNLTATIESELFVQFLEKRSNSTSLNGVQTKD